MKNIFKMPIGDWSQDGHNQSEEFVFSSNKTVRAMQNAYKDSCKLTGIQFNHNENYTGLPEHDGYRTDTQVCTEYGDSYIHKEAADVLTKYGINLKKYTEGKEDEDEDEKWLVTDPQLFAELILEFIKISLPGFKYEEASFKTSDLKKIKTLNGWWDKELNVQFGYGLFDAF
jgi:hypothetical protein